MNAPYAYRYDGPWVAAGEPVLGAAAGPPNSGNNIYICIFSVMGRAGHIYNTRHLIEDDKGHHAMQQMMPFTLIVHTHARYAPRPEYFDL